MSSISQNTRNENEISDFATKFIKEFKIGKLLFQCNVGKMKGIPVMDEDEQNDQILRLDSTFISLVLI